MIKFRKLFSLLIAAVSVSLCACEDYKNASLPAETRAADLVSRMTLDEKIGQMTQMVNYAASPDKVSKLCLGSVLSGGGGAPGQNTPDGWRTMVNAYQKAALSTRLGIPILYGNDSVHGQGNLHNATVFPHNIGLGAAHDEKLVEAVGKAAAEETAACGITWSFSPCVAVLADARWGRAYESFGSDTQQVSLLGTAYIRGFQSVRGMNATAKHYLGDGGTAFGSSHGENFTGRYLLDQGDTQCTEAYLREQYLPPYREAVQAGVRVVMASFSSWNGTKMHADSYLINNVLKGELGFTGFVVSDWAGIYQIDSDYYKAVVTSINAGIDMNMAPEDGERFIKTVKSAVEKKDISMERINNAVYRILLVKFQSGIFEHPYTDASYVKTVRNSDHIALARKAASESAVVLKNSGILPLEKSEKLYVCGTGADDIGRQCGGWTMTWQGKEGNITAGVTLRQALEQRGKDIVYAADGKFTDADRNAVCIVVVSEKPYAEGVGDRHDLRLDDEEYEVFRRASSEFSRIVLVVLSGRPVELGAMNDTASAVVAAWLPGSEGGDGIADILFGDVKPSAKLPVVWPAGGNKALYERGTGLSW
jgi:beta-glucosidase